MGCFFSKKWQDIGLLPINYFADKPQSLIPWDNNLTSSSPANCVLVIAHTWKSHRWKIMTIFRPSKAVFLSVNCQQRSWAPLQSGGENCPVFHLLQEKPLSWSGFDEKKYEFISSAMRHISLTKYLKSVALFLLFYFHSSDLSFPCCWMNNPVLCCCEQNLFSAKSISPNLPHLWISTGHCWTLREEGVPVINEQKGI